MALIDDKRQIVRDRVGGFMPVSNPGDFPVRSKPDWGNLTSEQIYGAQMLLKSGYIEVPQSYRQGDYAMGSVMTIGNKRYGIPAGSNINPISAEEVDNIISNGQPTRGRFEPIHGLPINKPIPPLDRPEFPNLKPISPIDRPRFPNPQPTPFTGSKQVEPIGGWSNPGGMGFWTQIADGSWVGGDSFTGQTRPIGWDPNNPTTRPISDNPRLPIQPEPVTSPSRPLFPVSNPEQPTQQKPKQPAVIQPQPEQTPTPISTPVSTPISVPKQSIASPLSKRTTNTTVDTGTQRKRKRLSVRENLRKLTGYTPNN